MHLHAIELPADLHHFPANGPPVGLELGLARAPRADAAAQALQVLPLAHEAREQIGKLGQLDLELALHGPRPLGEDVQDEGGAIDDLEAERPPEVSLLDGGERIVGDHEVGGLSLGRGLELVDLAFPEIELGRWRRAFLGDAAHHLRPRRLGQAAELVERFLDLEAPLLGQSQRREQRSLPLPYPPSRHFHSFTRSIPPV